MSLLNSVRAALTAAKAPKPEVKVEVVVKVPDFKSKEEFNLNVKADNAEEQLKELAAETAKLEAETKGIDKASARLEKIATNTPIAIDKFNAASATREAATARAQAASEALKALGF